jgi:tryptophanyl-tRNA synthetase
VPVGDDQRQHLELTRDIAERFNNRFGDTFTVPVGVQPKVASRVMDLQDPTRKMSKSISSPLGTIYLFDSSSDIERKISKAVTDTYGDVRCDWETKPGISNLLEIYASFAKESPDAIASRYTRYGDLKSDLAALMVENLSPLRERYDRLIQSPAELHAVAERGAQKASEQAGAVYRRAANAMGLV